MLYKPDFEQACERMNAWWHQEVLDRVCIQVTAPQPNRVEPLQPRDLQQRWLDMDYVLAATETRIRGTYHAGEAFPMLMPNLGPDAFAAYLGAELIFADTTTYVKPLITSWDEIPSLEFDVSAAWWQKMESMCLQALEYARGKFFVSLPDGHGGPDALAALRKPQNLCMDLVDHPDQVLAALERLDNANLAYHDRLFEIFHEYQDGGTGFVPAWGPGRTATSQCDFLALIGPQMGERFIRRSIACETEALDRSVFHLDGPDALVHLDMLLQIPGINAIQWVPGSGNPTAHHWLPYLKRIQQAGKGLWLTASGPQEVELLVRQLKPGGLMINTSVATPQEADELVAKVAGWTTERR